MQNYDFIRAYVMDQYSKSSHCRCKSLEFIETLCEKNRAIQAVFLPRIFRHMQ